MRMQPLYRDPCFTFRFAEGRIVSRIHVDGVAAGKRVCVYTIDAATGERLGLLNTAIVGQDGWIELSTPIVVNAGDAFAAVCEE